MQETIRQCENDALKAREKAKQELAALRVMSARDLSKARLEGANRVTNEMEVLQAQSEAKDAIMSGIKVLHTATRCNALQHTALHCTTLHHTAMHCNALQNTATNAS